MILSIHADGSDAKGPIAVCEVQGYVYNAKCQAAKLATAYWTKMILQAT